MAKVRGNSSKLVELVQQRLAKNYGDSVSLLRDDEARNAAQAVVPTGQDVVDHYLIRAGGFPAGNKGVTEVYGPEGGAKSSLCYAAMGCAQRGGGVAAWADEEHSGDAERLITLGCAPSDVLQLSPDHLEHLLEQIIPSLLGALPGDNPNMILWDSLAGTPTKAEVERGASGKEVWDTRAKTISMALRSITGLLAPANAALVIVNQPRVKIGVKFGNPNTTPGGQALKSTASLRLEMYGGKAVEAKGVIVGRLITVSVRKSRFGLPGKALLRLDGDGWNNEWSVLNLAKDLGLAPDKARGAKALADAYAALARKFPGFASAEPNAERAERTADEGETEILDVPQAEETGEPNGGEE